MLNDNFKGKCNFGRQEDKIQMTPEEEEKHRVETKTTVIIWISLIAMFFIKLLQYTFGQFLE